MSILQDPAEGFLTGQPSTSRRDSWRVADSRPLQVALGAGARVEAEEAEEVEEVEAGAEHSGPRQRAHPGRRLADKFQGRMNSTAGLGRSYQLSWLHPVTEVRNELRGQLVH